MKMKTVTCVGGANIDIQGFSNAAINMRDSNPGTVRLCPGGVGRNIAENLAWLGANVRMVTAVGEDPFAEMILRSCVNAGIDTSEIETIPGARSSSYLVLTDSDGDMLAAISDMHIMKQLNGDFILRHVAALDNADAILAITGETTFALPDGGKGNWQYAVTALDRCWNESDPVWK